MEHIIELEKGVFVAPWIGDPGRTLKKGSAKTFQKKDAEKFLTKIKEKYTGKFINAKIIQIRPNKKKRWKIYFTSKQKRK